MKEYNFKFYSKLNKDFWYVRSRQDLLKRILEKYYPGKRDLKKRGLKILDAGCGTGFNFEALNCFGAVYGVDLNKGALRQSRRFHYKKLELKDINKIKYKNYFDVIVAVELIEHIEDDEATLKNFYRYLKPSGLLVITAPAFNFLWSRDDELAMHKRRYLKKRLREIVTRAGFEIIHLTYRYFFYFFPGFFVFLLQRFKKNKNSLEYTPAFLNRMLVSCMVFENKLLSRKIIFPFGVGLLCIARKK
jgi:SAM-dependent methyltransferase